MERDVEVEVELVDGRVVVGRGANQCYKGNTCTCRQINVGEMMEKNVMSVV
jgi:hypothetical protein